MEAVHGFWAYVAVAVTGAVGLWGLGLSVAGRAPGRHFRWATLAAAAAMLLQVGLGLWLLQAGEEPGDDFHVFYGMVILFTFTFAYIFRTQLARRQAFLWGLLLLFVMGLGIRAWTNVGG